MLAIVAPGQGAQSPGFLAPWLDVPGARERLDYFSAVAGLDLLHYGTEGEVEEIRDTAVAQPLLVAAGLLAGERLGARPDAAAGHSVGEFTAAGLSGVLSPEAALVLVRERGAGMAEAAKVTPTGMTAVLGGDRAEVLAALDAAGLTPANDNGAGQIVAAGTLEELQTLAEAPPPRARLRPLQVAGAFHTRHMAPAVERLRRLAAGAAPQNPATRLLSNADGQPVDKGRDVLDRLVRQVSSPVRWDLCTDSLSRLGATAIIELPPAGTLVGLAKRALRGVELLALKTPDDLDRAHELLKEHVGGAPTSASEGQ